MCIELKEMLSFQSLIGSSCVRQRMVASNMIFSRPSDKKGHPPCVAEQLGNSSVFAHELSLL